MIQHGEFTVAKVFRCGEKRWLCTDIGLPVTICHKHDDDPCWCNGPPYTVAEETLDGYDMAGCAPEPEILK